MHHLFLSLSLSLSFSLSISLFLDLSLDLSLILSFSHITHIFIFLILIFFQLKNTEDFPAYRVNAIESSSTTNNTETVVINNNIQGSNNTTNNTYHQPMKIKEPTVLNKSKQEKIDLSDPFNNEIVKEKADDVSNIYFASKKKGHDKETDYFE